MSLILCKENWFSQSEVLNNEHRRCQVNFFNLKKPRIIALWKVTYKVSFYLITGKLEVFLDDRQAEKFSEKLFDVWDDYRNKSQRKKRKVCFS